MKDDKFINELINILNNIAIKRGSKNIFSFAMSAECRDYLQLSLLYTSKESKEPHIFFKQESMVSDNFTEEDALNSFKMSLIEAITYYKDYMSKYKSIRSMGTLLTNRKVERKIFNKYEINLLDEEPESYLIEI